MPKEELQNIASIFRKPAYLDKIIGEDEETVLGDVIPDSHDTEEEALNNLISKEIQNTMKILLTAEEFRVISCLYGIEVELYPTIPELSKFLGMSKYKIKSLKDKAFRKLSKSPLMMAFAEVM